MCLVKINLWIYLFSASSNLDSFSDNDQEHLTETESDPNLPSAGVQLDANLNDSFALLSPLSQPVSTEFCSSTPIDSVPKKVQPPRNAKLPFSLNFYSQTGRRTPQLKTDAASTQESESEDSLFTCSICPFQTDREKAYQKHMGRHAKHFCKICSFQGLNKAAF